ncbi:MAG: aldehyde dehydrogenase (NADP(+)) [Planctomycetota bacterium]
MADLTGLHLIAGESCGERPAAFTAEEAASGEPLGPAYAEATPAEVDRALRAADDAVAALQTVAPDVLAGLLDAIADGIVGLGDELIDRAHAESALSLPRLRHERDRTALGARRFAEVVRDGSWVQARIDRGKPDRSPLPKPDVRAMLNAVGPVVVFGASNFPLAISVAGTDTVSAIAARCPVVVKAHPAQPGTCELVAAVVAETVAAAGLPAGMFSVLHGAGHDIGRELVTHPLAKAVAFTGSLAGGRALFDAAAARPEPIPVYAEMGSINPVFVLPEAARLRGEEIAKEYVRSVNTGVGQFCTCPSVLLTERGEAADAIVAAVRERAAAVPPAAMLHGGILEAYRTGLTTLAAADGFEPFTPIGPDTGRTVTPVFFEADVSAAGPEAPVWTENFGPSSVVLRCDGRADMERVAASLEGHLSAAVYGEDDEIAAYGGLIRLLERRVGRIVYNGFTTGLDVCPSLHHGGPYPATTHSGYTSVGHAAIYRFAKPVCYQDFPDAALPPELRDANPRGLTRLVDGELTRAALPPQA